MTAANSDAAPVVVIGAGIVGMACATYLQRDGRAVTVIDPGEPGMGASYGNAGCFNGSSVVPVAMPGVASQVPRWLLDPEGPLRIRWRYLPALAPWLIRFVAAGRPERVREQARALRPLLAPAVDSYMALARDAGCAELIHRLGHLFAYQSEQSFAKDDFAMRLRRDNGIVIDELSADELRQLEPALARDYIRGRLVRENGHCGDPLRFIRALAESFTRSGGRILRERALGFATEGERVTAVRAEAGEHPASAVVIAAGAFSKPLAAALGDRVPLDTERGYHVMLRDPEVLPRTPTMSAEAKCVVTPMEQGLRIAGTVEFAGLEAPPDYRRARLLLRHGQRMYPGLARDIPEERLSLWMGHRPSMPDSLPVLGPATRFTNAFHAFGHGHVGLAAGAMSGQTIAALIAGRPPPIPLAPYSAGRFG